MKPNLNARHGVIFSEYDTLPVAVVRTYSEYPDCACSLQRLHGRVATVLEPLHSFGTGPWSFLEAGLADSYFVDQRFEGRANYAGQLFAVVPVAIGFVSVRLKLGMHCDVYEQNDGGKTLRHATARLPDFLRSTMRMAALVGINFSSDLLAIPDIRWFCGRGDGVGTHLSDDIRGTTRNRAALKFGDRWEWELHLLSTDDAHNWYIFADLGERSEGALWVALREDFRDVRRLLDPQAAYEAMLVHYLGGARIPFDFRPYAEAQSIW